MSIATDHPALVFADPVCALHRIVTGPLSNNVYLLSCAATGTSLLVDAASDAEDILALIRSVPTTLMGILTTHRHGDHHQALPEVYQSYPVTTYSSVADAASLPIPTQRVLDHGDHLYLGDLTVLIVELRGHTPGGLALAWRDAHGGHHLVSGDSLFPGGPGKTATPADFSQLMDDLTCRVFDVYPDSTTVYPGHGATTTLGKERPYLGTWRERGW